MSYILNIDTSAGAAQVSIGKHDTCIGSLFNQDQKEHASFLQPAIKQLLADCNLQLKDLNAVSVVNGPGSYTGLRVGLASAKGICYALGIPLITINTLHLMAKAAILAIKLTGVSVPQLCPMIDARRMEVYTAVYNEQLDELICPQAMILDSQSFVANLLQSQILFFGNGAFKMKTLTNSPNALFAGIYENRDALCMLAFEKFSQENFANLAYAEPFYLKEFFNK